MSSQKQSITLDFDDFEEDVSPPVATEQHESAKPESATEKSSDDKKPAEEKVEKNPSEKETTVNTSNVDIANKMLSTAKTSAKRQFTWTIDYIRALNNDAVSTPSLNNGVKLMRIEKSHGDHTLLRQIVGDVALVPKGELVLITTRQFEQNEIVTFVPIDYVRQNSTDIVYDVRRNVSVSDKKVLAQFEQFQQHRPNIADRFHILQVEVMPDVNDRTRSGSFLGTFAGEISLNNQWSEMLAEILPTLKKLIANKTQINDALKLFVKTYLRLIKPRANVSASFVSDGATKKDENITPLIALIAMCPIPANTILVLPIGILGRIAAIRDEDVKTALTVAACACDLVNLESELIKELLATEKPAVASTSDTAATKE